MNIASGLSGSAIWIWDADQAQIRNSVLRQDLGTELTAGGELHLGFSNIRDGLPPSVIDDGGNIDALPLFVRDPDNGGDGWGDDPDTPEVDESTNDDFGDLRLQPGSPSINAGDPDYIAESGETDLDGRPRVLCGRIDMGAYESGIGDYDCDGAVTLTDLSYWSACMTEPALVRTIAHVTRETGETNAEGTNIEPTDAPYVIPECVAFDFDADYGIDLLDFAGFQRSLSSQP